MKYKFLSQLLSKHLTAVFLSDGTGELKSIHTLQKLRMNELLFRHSYENLNNIIFRFVGQ